MSLSKQNFKEAQTVFKFLNKEHADKLLLQGNIFIPSFHDFSDKDKYTGKIYDEEGSCLIENDYTTGRK